MNDVKMSTSMFLGAVAIGAVAVMCADMDLNCMQRRSIKTIKRAKKKMHNMGIC